MASDELRQVLRHLHFERGVNRNGYVNVQRFYIYAERGLARKHVSIWLYEGRLQIAYREALLARYAYRFDRKQQRLHTIHRPILYQPAFASPQLELWKLDDEQWRKVIERLPGGCSRLSVTRQQGAQLALPFLRLLLFMLHLPAGLPHD